MLLTPADHWFGYCVKERVSWTCEYCHKIYPRGSQGLHDSHYFSRGNWATRFNPENSYAHCFFCHQKLGSNPDIFVRWVKTQLNDIRYQMLVNKSNDISLGKSMKQTKGKGEIAEYYKQIYEDMLKERAKGYMGRIEFIEWHM